METTYEMRELKSQDVFTMANIIKKIGYNEIIKTISVDNVSSIIDGKDNKEAIGFDIVMSVVGVIISNISECETEIYGFLASLTGLKSKEIADLPLVEFTEMIIAVIEKKEFRDFFRVVSRFIR